MKRLSKFTFLIIIFFTATAFVLHQPQEKIKILLMGDSTTIGGKSVLKESIETLLMAEEGMPEIEVINTGKGGETTYELIHSGRYDEEIKKIEDVDYIFFRYGLNDFIPSKAHRKNRPFEKYFKTELKEAIVQVKKDFPDSKIIMMSIISWRSEQEDELTNNIIKEVANEEKLEYFDIYTPYKTKEKELGEYSLRVRFAPLSVIPKNYHKIVAPFTEYVEWKKTDMVRVNTNEFDPIFAQIPEWYKDRHPNDAGYRLIADEMVRYLLPKLKE